jgi:two-component system cell cycle sensor histidine kinase/response regulator CckA
MIMPVMGGKDAFVAMKRINPDIIALLASGYSLNGEARSILDMGARGFIQKPFTIAELRKSISALFGETQ